MVNGLSFIIGFCLGFWGSFGLYFLIKYRKIGGVNDGKTGSVHRSILEGQTKDTKKFKVDW